METSDVLSSKEVFPTFKCNTLRNIVEIGSYVGMTKRYEDIPSGQRYRTFPNLVSQRAGRNLMRIYCYVLPHMS